MVPANMSESVGQAGVISPPLQADSSGRDASVKMSFQGPASASDEA